jgi:hypothetical protein
LILGILSGAFCFPIRPESVTFAVIYLSHACLMNKIAFSLFISLIQLIPFTSTRAQGLFRGYENLFLPEKHYVVYRTNDAMKIDGKADEHAWKKAEWTDNFADIEGAAKPFPFYPTRAKMLWDKNNLYILAELTEPNVWSYYETRDQIVYHENDFEVFIDPDRDTRNYYEFEMNAANTLFDLFLPKPYRNGGAPQIDWNAAGFKSAVSVDGTLNNPTDVDRSWIVEIAIPFKALDKEPTDQTPSDGTTWKIDFSRVEWQTEIINGKYEKKKDPETGRFLPENNWVWSPTGEINMHVPERWGLVQFSESPVNGKRVKFQVPPDEELAKYLWLVYYKQKDFRRAHGNYASSLSDLSMPDAFKTGSGIAVNLELKTGPGTFSVVLTTGDGRVLSLNDEGFIQKSHF